MDYTQEVPLGKLFNQLTKEYIGTLYKKLENLPLKRHFYPLLLIYKASGEMSQTCLAKELQMDKVSVVRLVDYLSEHDCVVRKKNPADRREQLLQCTSTGASFIPEISAALTETNELCVADLNEKEVRLLDKMLASMSRNLQEHPQDDFTVEFSKTEK